MKIKLHAEETYTTTVYREKMEIDTDNYPELEGMTEDEIGEGTLDYDIQQSDDWLAIGKTGISNGDYFKGVVDEVRIYNRALSDTEIVEYYRGIYKNETGSVLYLNFDGDAEDGSGYGNDGTIYGASWTTGGFVNMDVKVELDGNLIQTVHIINATDGSFTIPYITTPNMVGVYKYNIHVDHENSENQTIEIIVDNVKIIDSGFIESSRYVGQVQTVWFKAIYEFDGQEFNGTSGILYINGVSMKWSSNVKGWEYEFVPTELGTQSFEITGVLDRKYQLTSINDEVGPVSIVVYTTWYDPLNLGLGNPLMWVSLMLLTIILTFLCLGILRSWLRIMNTIN